MHLLQTESGQKAVEKSSWIAYLCDKINCYGKSSDHDDCMTSGFFSFLNSNYRVGILNEDVFMYKRGFR